MQPAAAAVAVAVAVAERSLPLTASDNNAMEPCFWLALRTLAKCGN